MRRAEHKRHGYIILPIAIPVGMSAEEALADHKRFRGVWQVLQALRAHDDRFDALVNKIELNPAAAKSKLLVGQVEQNAGVSSNGHQGSQLMLNVPEWRDAIYARIVQKVGTRTYWEQWADDVAEIAAAQQARIAALLDGARPEVREEFEAFVEGLQGNLNASIDNDQAVSMLSQHLITKPVFEALFQDYNFAASNPVSKVMDRMVSALEDQQLETETQQLEGFYASVKMRAEGIDNPEGKQRIIAELYERFFRQAFKKTADSLGIVYTPVEIVDFMLQAANDVLHRELGVAIGDQGVHVLDPFTGTGTFITRLMQSSLIGADDLARKYDSELHANEILLLAYYIAAVNIEATYHGVAGGDYRPFEGIALTDTFQITEDDDALDTWLIAENNDRIARLLETDVKVIFANPPYSVGQTSGNDQNQNFAYPTLDARIAETYAARSSAGLKRNLYDSYIRAFRWASDRLGEAGVVAYVTNAYFIDGGSFDGLRKALAEEFSAIYVFNLRGNQRGVQGEASRREGGKVFGQGSRTPVAITLLVKDPAHTGPATVYYRDIGGYLGREQKLELVAEARGLDGVAWEPITPNEHGDWINQRDERYVGYWSLGVPKTSDEQAVLEDTYLGLSTNRDAWVYGFDRSRLEKNVSATIDVFDDHLTRWPKYLATHGPAQGKEVVEDFIEPDPRTISWTRGLKTRLAAKNPRPLVFDRDRVVTSVYRPFCKQHLYFDPGLIESPSRQHELFPPSGQPNRAIMTTGVGSRSPFAALMVDHVPCLNMQDTGVCYPRYRYDQATEDPANQLGLDTHGDQGDGLEAVDNVSDAVIEEIRSACSDPAITGDDVFYYVYALLHHPAYRERYASELVQMRPRIPIVQDFASFERRAAGWRTFTLAMSRSTHSRLTRRCLAEARRQRARSTAWSACASPPASPTWLSTTST
jgi:predicted helicase